MLPPRDEYEVGRLGWLSLWVARFAAITSTIMFGTRCIMIRIDCPMIWQLMHASTMCVAIGLAIAWLVIRLTQTVIFKLQKKR